ncbi:hypothetical protein DdX_10465 [Ditylenchus destructor]|uniref:Uncharacterized protein n=1 Tax=Ditylenchus destructor TaxID=166010 RepID=A0AAD4N0X9_9BILA|nr:hypothetical protein DdX_10465 [Ditylenchus destructor]
MPKKGKTKQKREIQEATIAAKEYRLEVREVEREISMLGRGHHCDYEIQSENDRRLSELREELDSLEKLKIHEEK